MKVTREYFNLIRKSLKVNSVLEDDVIKELRTHIEDKIHDLEQKGCSEQEALETALYALGTPHHLAKQIYEVYSQGSWKEAMFAALPHLSVAILFFLQLWEEPFWIFALFLLVGGIALYGWFHDQPTWLFPWLGYCLVPVVVAGILLTYLPGSWAWVALLPYVIVSFLLLGFIGKQTIRKDWLLLSLTMLPVPIVIGWLLSLYLQIGALRLDMIYRTAPMVSLSFVVLSLAVLMFVRIKQRWIKVGILLIPEVALVSIMALTSEGAMSFLWWLFLVALSVFLLFSPAVIDRRFR
ncbi:MAG TPA: hypothetical protein DCX22_00160 [Dehalococcoidia bacterium]|nr:hypothetical protein [Dehalococcoidia bacterium]